MSMRSAHAPNTETALGVRPRADPCPRCVGLETFVSRATGPRPLFFLFFFCLLLLLLLFLSENTRPSRAPVCAGLRRGELYSGGPRGTRRIAGAENLFPTLLHPREGYTTHGRLQPPSSRQGRAVAAFGHGKL